MCNYKLTIKNGRVVPKSIVLKADEIPSYMEGFQADMLEGNIQGYSIEAIRDNLRGLRGV